MKVHFVRVSENKKTGPIPVSMTSQDSCPKSCQLKGQGCYAELGPTGMHWRKVDERGMSWSKFCEVISELPNGTLWRHNVAGDLPSLEDGVTVSDQLLGELLVASQGTKGFTYTHHALTPFNKFLFRIANQQGFTINLSADNLDQADEHFATGLPTVVVVPSDWKGLHLTNKGNTVVVCPAAISDEVTCDSCRLCYKADRKSIVGFPAHGARKKVINLRLENV